MKLIPYRAGWESEVTFYIVDAKETELRLLVTHFC